MRAGSALLIASLSLNALLSLALFRASQCRPALLPLSAAGWLDQPAAEGFERIPSTPQAVVFLGDSLTAEAPWGELFGPWLNRGVKGDTIGGVRSRMKEVLDRRPAIICLMIGVNDLLRGSDPRIVAEGLDAIVAETAGKSPRTRLLVLSILPVDEARFCDRIANATIREANEELKRVAMAHGLTYVDLHGAFIDARGGLRADLSYDGIHLTADGYVVWRDILSRYIGRRIEP